MSVLIYFNIATVLQKAVGGAEKFPEGLRRTEESATAQVRGRHTAVAFHTVAMGLPQVAGAEYVAGIPEILLTAISLGAVFFGAMTYIGNGPNFMVKAIAEPEGIKMPSFFGYILKFTLVVLLPVYIIVQLIFLPF